MDDRAEALIKSALEQRKIGNLIEAYKYSKMALSIQPDNPHTNYNFGDLLANNGKLIDSLGYLKKAVELMPTRGEFWLAFIKVLFASGRRMDAKKVFDNAVKLGMHGPETDAVKKELTAGAASNVKSPYKNLEMGKLSELFSRHLYSEIVSILIDVPKEGPEYANLHNIKGAAYARLRYYDAAIKSYQAALLCNEKFADAENNLGVAYFEIDNLTAAEKAFRRALAICPFYAEAHNNLGNLINKLGNASAALKCFKNALDLNPEYADAHNNLGNVHQKLGMMEDAEVCYKKALKIEPKYANAACNLAFLYRDLNDTQQAEKYYLHTLNLDNHHSDAIDGLATLAMDKGSSDKAISLYLSAINLNPESEKAYVRLSAALKYVRFTQENPRLLKAMETLLDRPTSCRPKSISSAIVSLLKIDPIISDVLFDNKVKLERISIEWINNCSKRLSIFKKLMRLSVIPDPSIEEILIAVRNVLLTEVCNVNFSEEILDFQSALSQHCFLNQYIYPVQLNEQEKVKNLEISVGKRLESGLQPTSQELLCLASYQALNTYPWCELLAKSTFVEEVIVQQVDQVIEETEIKKNIPSISKIKNDVSKAVRNQYETNPYPRWINLCLDYKPMDIHSVVANLNLRLNKPLKVNRHRPEVLIAGCGTGQHSLGTAHLFKGSKVLAIDLSLSSLAYAIRKSSSLSIKNIDYLQGDILDLPALNKKFDLVESVGVLHHMANPYIGWSTLVDCVKPGGLMKIGLYSEIARSHIVKIKKEISTKGINSSSEAMKSFREKLKNSNKAHHMQILDSLDFYDLNSYRDLLFHVQEQRYTIPRLKEDMKSLGLYFCGFENAHLMRKFKTIHTGPTDIFDLTKWDIFEKENPTAFSGMYQFWCQKIG